MSNADNLVEQQRRMVRVFRDAVISREEAESAEHDRFVKEKAVIEATLTKVKKSAADNHRTILAAADKRLEMEEATANGTLRNVQTAVSDRIGKSRREMTGEYGTGKSRLVDVGMGHLLTNVKPKPTVVEATKDAESEMARHAIAVDTAASRIGG